MLQIYAVIVAMLVVVPCAFAEIAERPLTRDFLIEQERRTPTPSSGVVDFNPPNFIWYAGTDVPDGREFLVQLSPSADFQTDVITSEPLSWPVFNPHKPLKQGEWFWRVATVYHGRTNWSDVIRFEISGSERDWCPPPADVLLNAIPDSHPRYLAKKEQIGSYLERSERVEAYVLKGAALLKEPLPDSLIYNDRKVLKEKRAALDDVNYTRFISKKTKEKFAPEVDKVYTLMRCYILTGNERFSREAVKRLDYFEEQHEDINKAGYYNDFTTGNLHLLQAVVFDTCYDQLNRRQRDRLSEEMAELLKKELKHMQFGSVHAATSSHFWQHHLRNFFTTAVIMKGHDPIADECIRFVYALWNAKAPVGSRGDGGWAPGNGYFGANTETLALMPLWLKEYTGFNFYNHPWWSRVGEYLMYTSPVGHIAGGFGDHSEVYTESMIRLIKALAYTTREPHVVWYAQNSSKPGDLEIQLRKNLDWFIAPYAEGVDWSTLPAAKPGSFAVFPDVGNAAFHSDMTLAENNATLMFRSCPLGSLGHGHPSQNVFNICHGGRPLFFHTGYYSSWADFHSLQSYKHTRAHNTVLADGLGQQLSTTGYGWLPRSLAGERIRYVVGDASQAYDGSPMLREEFYAQFKRWDVPITRENGFGDPGVTRFRRHIVALDNSLFLIYDELGADQPVTWNWLLHSWNRMDLVETRLKTFNETGQGAVELFCSVPFTYAITDEFHAPADDWLGNGKKKGIEYVNQWHARMDTTEKQAACRFLAVIQIRPKDEPLMDVVQLDGGSFSLGDWTINAAMDVSAPARLEIRSKDGNTSFVTGIEKSVLIEGKSRQEAVDIWPDAAIYY